MMMMIALVGYHGFIGIDNDENDGAILVSWLVG